MNDQAKLKSATKNVGTLELDPNILTYYIRGVRKEELLLKRLLRYLLCDSHPHVWIWGRTEFVVRVFLLLMVNLEEHKVPRTRD